MTFEQENQNIMSILNDLYHIDASLRTYEKELIELIKQLIQAKPDVAIDENFKIRLRNEVLIMIKEIRQSPVKDKRDFEWTSPLTRILRPVAYGLAVALVLVAVIVPIILNKGDVEIEDQVVMLDEQENKDVFNGGALAPDLRIEEVNIPMVAGGGEDLISKIDIEPVAATLPLGQEMTISLASNPTTGFSWQMDFDEQYIELISDQFMPSEEQGLVGAGGTQIFKFKSLKKGGTEITFLYTKPWEGEQEDTQKQVYDLTIK